MELTVKQTEHPTGEVARFFIVSARVEGKLVPVLELVEMTLSRCEVWEVEQTYDTPAGQVAYGYELGEWVFFPGPPHTPDSGPTLEAALTPLVLRVLAEREVAV